MLAYVIIGLTCNSIGCYWVEAQTQYPVIYTDVEKCKEAARDLRVRSAAFFDTSCIVTDKMENEK